MLGCAKLVVTNLATRGLLGKLHNMYRFFLYQVSMRVSWSIRQLPRFVYVQ